MSLRINKAILLLCCMSVALGAFEQNGVKEGNTRVSASLYSNQNNDTYDTVNFNTQLGHFMNDHLELLLGMNVDGQKDDLFVTLSPGINYYPFNTPILTSYIGTQFYYWNTTNEYIKEKTGNAFYVGTHIFITENVAVTPEFGAIYEDTFDVYHGTYFNTFLSYFF